MSDFKVGERVACYSWFNGRETGTITEVLKSGVLRVKLDSNTPIASSTFFHSKACRRLFKKKKKPSPS